MLMESLEFLWDLNTPIVDWLVDIHVVVHAWICRRRHRQRLERSRRPGSSRVAGDVVVSPWERGVLLLCVSCRSSKGRSDTCVLLTCVRVVSVYVQTLLAVVGSASAPWSERTARVKSEGMCMNNKYMRAWSLRGNLRNIDLVLCLYLIYIPPSTVSNGKLNY